MARGNPPPLPDDPSDAPPKVAQDEIAAIHGAAPPPPPVFQPPPPPKAPPLPIPDMSSSMSPPAPPPGLVQPMPSYTPPPPQSSSNNFSAADFGSADLGPVKPDEHWMKAFWRPAMGWLYMVICFMDFVGFPLLTIFLPIIFKPFGLTMPYTAWQSITLSNGGLMHLAFGAILGVSAFTRGQEKTAGMMK